MRDRTAALSSPRAGAPLAAPTAVSAARGRGVLAPAGARRRRPTHIVLRIVNLISGRTELLTHRLSLKANYVEPFPKHLEFLPVSRHLTELAHQRISSAALADPNHKLGKGSLWSTGAACCNRSQHAAWGRSLVVNINTRSGIRSPLPEL